jgi:hypothetical protein
LPRTDLPRRTRLVWIGGEQPGGDGPAARDDAVETQLDRKRPPYDVLRAAAAGRVRAWHLGGGSGAVPGRPLTELDSAVAVDQARWRQERRWLNQHCSELARLAAQAMSCVQPPELNLIAGRGQIALRNDRPGDLAEVPRGIGNTTPWCFRTAESTGEIMMDTSLRLAGRRRARSYVGRITLPISLARAIPFQKMIKTL